MANNHSKQNKPKTKKKQKVSFTEAFAKLDKKSRMQVMAIGALLLVIIVAAAAALIGGSDKEETSAPLENSMIISGSYDPQADKKYEDDYTKKIREYDDIIIPESDTEDRNYFRETIFVGDSNTEGLSAYGHLSLQ